MREHNSKYRQYRSYGHDRLTSCTLAVPAIIWFGTPVVIGLLVGLWL